MLGSMAASLGSEEARKVFKAKHGLLKFTCGREYRAMCCWAGMPPKAPEGPVCCWLLMPFREVGVAESQRVTRDAAGTIKGLSPEDGFLKNNLQLKRLKTALEYNSKSIKVTTGLWTM